MFIYNVTINVDESVHEEWLKWMKEKHMNDVMSSGCFTSNRLLRVLADDEGATYSAQYHFNAMEDFARYKADFGPAMQQDAHNMFGGKFVAYRTLLEIMD